MFSWAGLKLRSFTSLPHAEEKKSVIEDSFALALKRGLLVHLVPVSVAASIIALNLAGIYFGPSLDYGDWRTQYTLAMFQVIAKVQVGKFELTKTKDIDIDVGTIHHG